MQRFVELVDSNFLVSRACDELDYECNDSAKAEFDRQFIWSYADSVLPISWKNEVEKVIVACCLPSSSALQHVIRSDNSQAVYNLGDFHMETISEPRIPCWFIPQAKSLVLLTFGKVPEQQATKVAECLFRELEISNHDASKEILCFCCLSRMNYMGPPSEDMVCRSLTSSYTKASSRDELLSKDLGFGTELENPTMLYKVEAALLAEAEFRHVSAVAFIIIDDLNFVSGGILQSFADMFGKILAISGLRDTSVVIKSSSNKDWIAVASRLADSSKSTLYL
mmetsp:Transcript_13996/g.23898  ORF Transcript_13996/g.23898 Transcript_13996/m.23898 type:complete len:281 (-) Transcript_13996:857-1699(-)